MFDFQLLANNHNKQSNKSMDTKQRRSDSSRDKDKVVPCVFSLGLPQQRYILLLLKRHKFMFITIVFKCFILNILATCYYICQIFGDPVINGLCNWTFYLCLSANTRVNNIICMHRRTVSSCTCVTCDKLHM